VRLVMKGKRFWIDRISLRLEANVAGIDEDTFQKIAAAAKQDCPLSKALASVPEIALTEVLRELHCAPARKSGLPSGTRV